MPVFSIVIPTYNQAGLLKKCIDSILSQSFQDFEIIIVDNNSNDDTKSVVNSINDSRIILFEINNEGVVARSRNMGIDNAKGEWICLLDSDDIWYSTKLEETNRIIETNPGIALISHCMMLTNVSSFKKRIMTWKFTKDNLYEYLLRHGNKFQNSALTINKSFIEIKKLRIDESSLFKSVEDYDFILKIAYHGGVFAYINKPLGEYKIYGNNMSMSDFHLVNLENLLKHHVYNIQSFETNKDKLWREVYVGVLLKKMVMHLHRRDYALSISFFLRAIFSSPKRVFFYIVDRLELLRERIISY